MRDTLSEIVSPRSISSSHDLSVVWCGCRRRVGAFSTDMMNTRRRVRDRYARLRRIVRTYFVTQRVALPARCSAASRSWRAHAFCGTALTPLQRHSGALTFEEVRVVDIVREVEASFQLTP